jgi:hypothetical protein
MPRGAHRNLRRLYGVERPEWHLQPSGSVTQNGAASRTAGTPPVIQINGDNPAIIHIGDTYADLGATITGPTPDLSLGVLYLHP